MDAIIANVRTEFAAKSEEILKFSKPWTPWALVALLNIDDSHSDIPAEQILYEALQKKNRRLGVNIAAGVQVLSMNILFLSHLANLYFISGRRILCPKDANEEYILMMDACTTLKSNAISWNMQVPSAKYHRRR